LASGPELGFQLSESANASREYFRPSEAPREGREIVFAASQPVVMGTHPSIPNLIVIGNLGRDLPEEYVVPALSHEEVHNALNKLGSVEKAASIGFLDRIGRAVTELDASGLASETNMDSTFRQFRAKKILNRMRN
jgi:hypothetical protein